MWKTFDLRTKMYVTTEYAVFLAFKSLIYSLLKDEAGFKVTALGKERLERLIQRNVQSCRISWSVSFVQPQWRHHANPGTQDCFQTATACVFVPILCILVVQRLKKQKKSSSFFLFFFFYRHSSELELYSHAVLGPQSLWHFLHPGCTRALLHWRFHCVLHHHETLPVLPHAGQHSRLPAESPSAYLVSNVLFFRVQRQWTSTQRVLLAFLQARCDEEADWIVSRIHVALCGIYSLRVCCVKLPTQPVISLSTNWSPESTRAWWDTQSHIFFCPAPQTHSNGDPLAGSASSLESFEKEKDSSLEFQYLLM